jgi:hypothetical protein
MLRKTLVLIAGVTAGTGAASAKVPQDLITTTTLIGRLALGMADSSGVISPDSAHLAFPGMSDATGGHSDALRLYIDGKPTPPSDQLTPPVYSPDSQHVAYAYKGRDHWQLVLDDHVIVNDADAVPATPILFSPDSKHTATVIQKAYKWYVAVDNKPWPIMEVGTVELPSFSPDGKHFAVVGRLKNAAAFFEDGAQVAMPKGETKALERIFPSYVWKPNSAGIGFYGAFFGKHWQVFATGDAPFESAEFDAIARGSPAFSADGSRVAFGAQLHAKWTLYTNRDHSTDPPFTAIPTSPALFLATDGGGPDRLLYLANRNSAWQLYLDHQPVGDAFDHLVEGTFVVSSDRKHFAFAVLRGPDTVIVRDGKDAGAFDAVKSGTFAFSPDSAHLAFAAKFHERWRICVDSVPGEADFAGVTAVPISFSPNSRQVAFSAELNPGAARLYVGTNADFQSNFFDSFLPGCAVHWRGNTALVVIAVNKHVAYRLEAQLP